jgi:hypothetical protein
MTSRTKKVAATPASDTVTFTKKELIKKLKTFLQEEDACDGDWLNKVKVKFLGQKFGNVLITLRVPATCEVEMACDGGLPSLEDAADFVREELEQGNLDLDFDEDKFEVVKVEKP